MGLLDNYKPLEKKGEGSYLRQQFPSVYGALAGLLGTAPDDIQGSVMDANTAAARNAAGYTYLPGLVASALPTGAAKGTGAAIAGMFVGKGAKTWDALAAAKALQLEKAGTDARKIWSETGTWKGPDGHWRQEIPDNGAYSKLDYLDSGRVKRHGNGEPYSVDEYLKHDNLFNAYEGIGDIPLFPNKDIRQDAVFNPSDGSIHLSFGEQNKLTPHSVPRTVNTSLEEIGYMGSPPSNLLHELQHYIQQKEGFSLGGSYRDTDYLRLAGEAEARATQARIPLTAEQRRATFPEDSYDVPIDQLIIRGLLAK